MNFPPKRYCPAPSHGRLAKSAQPTSLFLLRSPLLHTTQSFKFKLQEYLGFKGTEEFTRRRRTRAAPVLHKHAEMIGYDILILWHWLIKVDKMKIDLRFCGGHLVFI